MKLLSKNNGKWEYGYNFNTERKKTMEKSTPIMERKEIG